MKKNIKILLLIFGIVGMSLPMIAPTAQAAPVEYPLLEKIPGTDGLSGSDLPGYLNAVYKVALIVVTLSAVFMLSVGGFMYLTSAGNTSSISTAKGIIYDSLIGLVIALSAWLILYIINPDLVVITLEGLPPVASQATQATPGGLGTLPPESSQALAQQILANGSITLQGDAQASCSSASGKVSPKKNVQDVAAGKLMAGCSNGCSHAGGCTDNTVRPSEKMLQAIWTVGQTIPFTITSMSGGSHGVKSSHYAGQAIDIAPVSQALMDAFVRAGALQPSAPPVNAACQMALGLACGAGQGASMCESVQGRNVGCNPANGADHIHIVFSN